MFKWFSYIAMMRTLKAMGLFLGGVAAILALIGIVIFVVYMILVKFGILGFGIVLALATTTIITIITYIEHLSDVRKEQQNLVDTLRK